MSSFLGMSVPCGAATLRGTPALLPASRKTKRSRLERRLAATSGGPTWWLLTLASISAMCSGGMMPMPAAITPGTGKLRIDSSFSVVATGFSDARLESAMRRLTARISKQTGLDFHGGKTVLTIECRESGFYYPTLGEDESYTLDITADGARLRSATVTGALRGMETFLQAAGSGEASAVHIEDQPRYPWRGLMLDVSRHWMPVEAIERNLDAMAAVKLNVFHWHLSDDQGFRVESRKFPRLHGLGSDGHFYTQVEVRDIIEYARERGIRVIPEFDIPGHTTSWFAGYPELASAPGPYQIERRWGIFKPTMDPSREETYAFLDAFIGEMAGLFPDGYFHIGGDEVEPAQWNESSRVQDFARMHGLKTTAQIHGFFNQKVQQMLAKRGKTMIGWDEVLSGELARDTVIQSWRGQASLAEAARLGFRGILSFGYYLDHLKPASFHYAVDPGNALGGEACMWSEYVSAETVDSRIWPRMAAIAERFWSPANVTDVDSMYARLPWRHLSIDPSLRVLAEASEALGIEGRRGARQYTSEVALNRFVDLVPPESETVRRMEMAIRSGDFDSTHATLVAWTENRASGELEILSKNLSILGSIGLSALEFIRSGQPAPPGWIAQQIEALKPIEKPAAEVNLAAVRPVRMLIEAAGERHIK